MEFFASIALGFSAFINSLAGLPSDLYHSVFDEPQSITETTSIQQPEETSPGNGRALPERADAATYIVLYEGNDGMYAKDKNSVYYSTELLKWEPKVVVGADPETFEVLYTPEGKLTHYGKDKDRTYLRLFVVANGLNTLPVQTETPVSGGTSVVTESSRQTSAPSYSGQPSTLPPNVIAVYGPAKRPANLGAPKNTEGEFTIIHQDVKGAYGKDTSRVYHISSSKAWTWDEVEGADPASFEIIYTPQNIISLYAKDKYRVYHDTEEVYGADPNTFYVFSGAAVPADSDYHYYAKDKNAVYSFELAVDDADPSTFEPITFMEHGIGTYSMYGKDRSGIYCDNRVVWADHATFQVLDYNSAIDKTHAFEFCNHRTERVSTANIFDDLVATYQAKGVGIGPLFDTSLDADWNDPEIISDLTKTLAFMKDAAEVYKKQQGTYEEFCLNAGLEKAVDTLLGSFYGWMGFASIGCVTTPTTFAAVVHFPGYDLFEGRYCVDNAGHADLIPGHAEVTGLCPNWEYRELSDEEEGTMTLTNMLILQKDFFAYKLKYKTYEGSCGSTDKELPIAARIQEMPVYGTWQVLCKDSDTKFMVEARLPVNGFACIDSLGNRVSLLGTSKDMEHCDIQTTIDLIEQDPSRKAEFCTGTTCVSGEEYLKQKGM